jgi:hypothetical protein
MRSCVASLSGLLALMGCTGNPVEALPPGGEVESTSVHADVDSTGTRPSDDSGASMEPGGAAGSDTTSTETSTGAQDGATTGATQACGDGVAEAGEWCWFDPTVIPNITGVGALAVGSLDADEDLEIVVTNAIDAPLLVEAGGAGWTVLAIGQLPPELAVLVAGDLDGDGFDDIVGTNDASTMAIAFGGEDGLRSGQTLDAHAGGGILGLFDGDADGDLDVVHARVASSEVDFYENDLGVIAHWISTPGSGTSHVDLDVADVDGDGFRDLIVMGLPGWFDVYRADATAQPMADGNEVSDGTSRLGAGDLDGDGWVDVARLVPDGDALALFRGHADGWEAPVVLPIAVDLVDLDLADLDGDGDLDVAVAGGPDFVVFENLGKAELAPREAIPLALSAERIDLADLDRNGRAEALLRSADGLEIVIANP